MTKYKAIKVDGVKHDYHRWLMEQKLGRKLDRDEIVHHLNEDKSDNDINNLCVMTRSEHAKLHSKPPYFPETARERSLEYLTTHPNASRKLTEEDVDFIRKHYIPRDKNYGARALGRKFNVPHPTILRILSGEYYKIF